MKNLRCLLHKRTKVEVFVWKGIRKNIISYYSSAFPINPQPQRRSVRSHSVLFNIMWCFRTCQKLEIDTAKPRCTATSLLRPLFLAALQNRHSFSWNKNQFFFWPIGDRISGVQLYWPKFKMISFHKAFKYFSFSDCPLNPPVIL